MGFVALAAVVPGFVAVDVAAFDGGDVVLLRGVDFLDVAGELFAFAAMIVIVMVVVVMAFVIVIAVIVMVAVLVVVVLGGAQRGLFLGMAPLLRRAALRDPACGIW